MDGKYSIDTSNIRALAIQCHALDIQFDQLFNQHTICGDSDKIYKTHSQMLSAALLNLAISIRVSLNSEPTYKNQDSGISACGIFQDNRPFSIKDVCDKIIHAERIHKPREFGASATCCTLEGSYKGSPWDLGLSVQIFSEYILKWLDEIDNKSIGR